MAALQDSSSASSTDLPEKDEGDLHSMHAELQALENEIQELKESLGVGASGLGSPHGKAEARGTLLDKSAYLCNTLQEASFSGACLALRTDMCIIESSTRWKKKLKCQCYILAMPRESQP